MFNGFLGRHALIIFVALLIGGGTLGLLFLVRPQLQHFQQVRAEVIRLSEGNRLLEGKMKRAQLILDQAASNSPDDIAKLKAIFVSDPEIAYLTTSLRSRAQAARWFLNAIEVGGGRAEGGKIKSPLEELNIQLQLTGGGYREFKELLKLFTISVPLIEVSSFTFDLKSASASFNLKAVRLGSEAAGVSGVVDTTFFENPKFKALRSAVPLPTIKDEHGRENPFVEAPNTSAVKEAVTPASL